MHILHIEITYSLYMHAQTQLRLMNSGNVNDFSGSNRVCFFSFESIVHTSFEHTDRVSKYIRATKSLICHTYVRPTSTPRGEQNKNTSFSNISGWFPIYLSLSGPLSLRALITLMVQRKATLLIQRGFFPF